MNNTNSITAYFRRRPLAAFFLGISSGFPLTLLLSTMSYWLASVGLDKKTIGFAFALGTPYTLKFLWSPFIDKLPVPLLSKLIGQRRAWLYVTQALLVIAIIKFGFSDPLHHKDAFALWGIGVAFLGATQDIIIDAYRIEILPHDELVYGTAMNQFGYRIGFLAAGAGTVWLQSKQGAALGWPLAYSMTASLVMFGAIAAALSGDTARPQAAGVQNETSMLRRLSEWSVATIAGPIIEFFKRIGTLNAVLILAFVVLYKVGDAMGQNMLGPFFKDMKFSDKEYITLNKLIGFWSLIAGTAVAAPILVSFGKMRSLLIAALFMILANFGFAMVGGGFRSIYLMGGAIGMDSFATGVGLTIFTTYLSELTSRTYTASQFALLSSLAAVARTFLTTQSGRLVEGIGWFNFYIFCGLAFIPSLIILFFLNKRQLVTNEIPKEMP